ncbi:putative peptide ABC transporter DppA [Actinorhabdospora filicis]|uniref:Peptide ABC transporter DppA n=1 Tax=Actinorhabdospora filicis TaxID=1785913 RepID=A0A9W6SN93_9ACTN|nr:ABC transporter substrate-binding protein [Actinorhabdospora filicis]GLZ80020.1 putative peptide ABC transporter DppA [Actinorhabdospora filicis]
MRIRRVMALAVATALATTACSTGGGSDSEGATDGTINLAQGTDPAHMITTDATETVSSSVLRMMYDGLFSYSNTGDLVPVLAEAVPTSTDNIHWTIKVKQGTKFQNGEAVDANAFVRAWNYGAYGPHAQGGASFFSRIKGYDDVKATEDPDGDGPNKAPDPKAKELSGLKATDASTISVELTAPFAGFPTMLGYTVFWPMADECMQKIDACKEKPIGNGPFALKEWQHDIALTIERWDAYQGNKPAYKTIKWRIFPDGAPTWTDFEANQLDIDAPPTEQYQDAKAKYGERMLEVKSPSLSYIGLPLYDPTFAKKEIRQALSLAIDRDLLNQALYQGRYTPADSFAPPGIIFGATAGTCAYCKLDVAKAKELLAKAGGWPAGKKLQLWINTAASGANEKWVKAVGDQIKQNLGIEYEYHLEEWNKILQLTQDHKIDGPFRMGWSPDYNYVENYLVPIYGGGAKVTRTGYESEAFTKAVAEADAAPNLQDSVAKYQAAERILGEDMPGIPVFFSKSATVYSDRFDPASVVVNPVMGAIDLRLVKLK